KYLPVLKNFPTRYIHEPWNAPEAVQKAAKCIVGKEYSLPMVNHVVVSRINMERYEAGAPDMRPAVLCPDLKNTPRGTDCLGDFEQPPKIETGHIKKEVPSSLSQQGLNKYQPHLTEPLRKTKTKDLSQGMDNQNCGAVLFYFWKLEVTLECGQYPSSRPSPAHTYVFVYTYSSVLY
ncbi:unnamed protein product, partial [Timema podura]|nr:unnamed protein product [Timema podura]